MRNNEERFIGKKEDYKFVINGKSDNVGEEILKRKEHEISNGMQKYMPIGSVVSLNNSNTKYMIIGFNFINNNKKFDYIACLYPFGFGDNAQNIFNHDDIEKVYHVGFINNAEKVFKSELNQEDSRKKGM